LVIIAYALIKFKVLAVANKQQLKRSFQMNKKIFVVSIALVLFALVAGVVFAGELRGVSWYTSSGTTYITNNNDRTVRVLIQNENGGSRRSEIGAGQTITLSGEWTVIRVQTVFID
jgi:hypothetical protein